MLLSNICVQKNWIERQKTDIIISFYYIFIVISMLIIDIDILFVLNFFLVLLNIFIVEFIMYMHRLTILSLFAFCEII